MSDSLTILELTDIIRQTAFEVQTYLRHGFLEKIYENSLSNRLRKKGLTVAQQQPLIVIDEDETVLGEYFADLLINNEMIVELKACKSIADEHTAQLLGYMKASGKEHGILINFGAPRLQIRKLIL